jgi:hypothetical protein
MTEPGTLSLGEPHPAARVAFAWVREYLLADATRAAMLLESFASNAIEGNRLAEICGETLRRVMASEPVSDRYLLALAWTLRDMELMEKAA